MSSRKLLALDFIKRYFAQWGRSPTLGELGAALGVSTKRAHDLVQSLASDRAIEHLAGKTRGIRLPDRAEELSEADVLVRLAALGWTVEDGNRLMPPGIGAMPRAGSAIADAVSRSLAGLTEKELPLPPELDHIEWIEEAGTNGKEGRRGKEGRGSIAA
jgi:hypothetical protein